MADWQIPVLTKIDLPTSDPELSLKQMEAAFGERLWIYQCMALRLTDLWVLPDFYLSIHGLNLACRH